MQKLKHFAWYWNYVICWAFSRFYRARERNVKFFIGTAVMTFIGLVAHYFVNWQWPHIKAKSGLPESEALIFVLYLVIPFAAISLVLFLHSVIFAPSDVYFEQLERIAELERGHDAEVASDQTGRLERIRYLLNEIANEAPYHAGEKEKRLKWVRRVKSQLRLMLTIEAFRDFLAISNHPGDELEQTLDALRLLVAKLKTSDLKV